MTVPSQTPINQYTANGVTTVFAYTFRIDSESDLKIYSNDTVISSGFTVSGVGVNTGGSITFTTAPVSGAIITILRNMAALRATDYQNSGDFRAETANGDFDKLWLYMQQLRRDVDKSLHRKENDTHSITLNILPTPEVGKALAWGATGDVVNRSIDQTTIIGNGEASDLSAGLIFNTLEDAINLIAADGRNIDIEEILPGPSSVARVSTRINNTTSKKGGADYEIKTLAQHRTDIGDIAWVPDGKINHYLLGGTTYVLILMDIEHSILEKAGAIGNGVTDDTAVFTTLETVISDKFINLNGRDYAVSAQPSGNFYYNGGFIVGGLTYKLVGSADGWHYADGLQSSESNENIKPSLNGSFVNGNFNFAKTLKFKPLNSRVTRHMGLTSAIFEASNGKVCLVTREALSHGDDLTGKIELYTADHGGRNFSPTSTTLLDTASVDDRDFAFAIMDSGRVGLVVSRVFASLPPVFVYSDDSAATWNTLTVSAAPDQFATWFGLHKWPTSVGGADVGGWIAYGSVEGTWDGIRYVATTDNGATWTSGNALPGASVHQGSEPTVCRLGNNNFWVMVYRDNTVLRNPGLISFSTDMLTWSAPQELDFILGKNPPYLFYKDGLVYLFASMRDGGISTFANQNKLIYMHTPAYKLLEQNHGDFKESAIKPLASFDYLLGYFTLNKSADGSYLGSLAFGERPDWLSNPSVDTGTRICLVSNTDSIDMIYSDVSSAYTFSGVLWRLERNPQTALLRQLASGLTLSYASAGALNATVTFAKAFDNSISLSIIPVFKNGTFSTESPDKLGIIRVDNITASSCRITLFSTDGGFVSGDTASVDMTVEGYSTITDL